MLSAGKLTLLETIAKHLRNGWIFVTNSQQNECFSDVHTKIKDMFYDCLEQWYQP